MDKVSMNIPQCKWVSLSFAVSFSLQLNFRITVHISTYTDPNASRQTTGVLWQHCCAPQIGYLGFLKRPLPVVGFSHTGLVGRLCLCRLEQKPPAIKVQTLVGNHHHTIYTNLTEKQGEKNNNLSLCRLEQKPPTIKVQNLVVKKSPSHNIHKPLTEKQSEKNNSDTIGVYCNTDIP